VLPGANAVLYSSSTSGTSWDDAGIVVQPLPSGTPKMLIRGGYHAPYLPSGHIVYIHSGILFAAPFDLRRLEVTGPAAPAVEGVFAQTGTGAADFSVSQTGVLAYIAGTGGSLTNPVTWLSRDGKTAPLRAAPFEWSDPHFSPDGGRLALDSLRGNLDVWVYEWARDTLTRLTFGPGNNRSPVWSPDGGRIVFSSNRAKGAPNLYWQRADGTGEAQRLTESPNPQYAASFHPGGKYLAFYETMPNNSDDLMILPLDGDEKSGWKPGKPSAFLSTPANEYEPMFSPDGRWIAHASASDESGRIEVFVRPFPGPGGKWQISTNGGFEAAWSLTKHELLFRGADTRIMAVSYTVEGDSFKADKPHVWSDQVILPLPRTPRFFDLHPDGERLAVAIPPTGPEQKIDHVTFVLNFFDELRRLAPPSKK
jgi:serine/threonine-protein kinase